MADIGGKKLTTGEIIIIVSGAVALIFSFFNWIGEGDFGENAWGDFFPLATYVAIFGTIMALQIVLTKFANMNMPAHVLGFRWDQIHLALGVFAFLVAFGWLIVLEDQEIGFWLSLLASIGLVVGAVMLQRERGVATTTGTTGTAPPTPF